MAELGVSDGDVPTAAGEWALIDQQLVISCTSGTRPSALSMRAIAETDTLRNMTYDGTTWQPTWKKPGTYTPTLVGMAVGTGGGATNTAAYAFGGAGGSIEGDIVFGTSGTTFPSSTTTISLPSGWTFKNVTATRPIGDVTMTLGGVSFYYGILWIASSTTARLMLTEAASTYGRLFAPSTTAPATWAAGDRIEWRINAQMNV